LGAKVIKCFLFRVIAVVFLSLHRPIEDVVAAERAIGDGVYVNLLTIYVLN
jgi:hypothetical protein